MESFTDNLKRAFIVCLLIYTLAGLVLKARADDWSFKLHPAIPLLDHSHEQLRVLFDRWNNRPNYDCSRMVDSVIDLYIETYPDFAFYATMPVWRQRWIDAFTVSTYRMELYCAQFYEPRDVIATYARSIQADEGRIPFFCGRYTDRQLPEPVAEAVRTMVRLAFEDSVRWAAFFLMMPYTVFHNPVWLNADAAYYLVQRISYLDLTEDEPIDGGILWESFEQNWGGPQYSLTPERRVEITKAAQRDDAAAILATTPPCRRYQKTGMAE